MPEPPPVAERDLSVQPLVFHKRCFAARDVPLAERSPAAAHVCTWPARAGIFRHAADFSAPTRAPPPRPRGPARPIARYGCCSKVREDLMRLRLAISTLCAGIALNAAAAAGAPDSAAAISGGVTAAP